nr:EAL domain-containing protein [Shewanella sp. NIFS-20-20]
MYVAKSRRYPIEATAVISFKRVLISSKHYFLPWLLLLTVLTLLLTRLWHLRRELHQSIGYRLRDAVKKGQLQAFYHPIVDIRTGDVIAAEALIRWIQPNGQILSPVAFIDELEQSTLIAKVTSQVLAAIPSDLAEVFAANPKFRCGVNLIAAQIETEMFTVLWQQLAAKGYPAYRLALEITERSPIQDIELASDNLSKLKSLGCLIELDDAGTGYSGGYYVQRLPFNVMKIDKLFIDTVDEEANKSQVLDAYVAMARGLGMEVIAEGVESQSQSLALLARGVYFQQGYLFAKPMAAKEFTAWCRQQTSRQSTAN